MSPLARHLGRRQVHGDRQPGGAGQGVPLARLSPGQSARIVGFSEHLPATHSRRLFDLGFVPGSQITVVRRAAALDPSIYRVTEVEFALRRALAAGILVEP